MGKGDISALNTKRTRKEREALARKAGQASGIARKQQAELRQELKALLAEGDTQTRISAALIEQAMKGNVKAFETIRDTIGEKPSSQVEVFHDDIIVEIE